MTLLVFAKSGTHSLLLAALIIRTTSVDHKRFKAEVGNFYKNVF